MTDFIDQTTNREQAITDTAVANRVKYAGFSAAECEHCGEAIPEARRLAVPGCTACVWCASAAEGRRV